MGTLIVIGAGGFVALMIFGFFAQRAERVKRSEAEAQEIRKASSNKKLRIHDDENNLLLLAVPTFIGLMGVDSDGRLKKLSSDKDRLILTGNFNAELSAIKNDMGNNFALCYYPCENVETLTVEVSDLEANHITNIAVYLSPGCWLLQIQDYAKDNGIVFYVNPSGEDEAIDNMATILVEDIDGKHMFRTLETEHVVIITGEDSLTIVP